MNRITRFEAARRIGWKIRSTHRYAYRTGEWGRVRGIGVYRSPKGGMRLCYDVRWPGGYEDTWPVNAEKIDGLLFYEFIPATRDLISKGDRYSR